MSSHTLERKLCIRTERIVLLCFLVFFFFLVRIWAFKIFIISPECCYLITFYLCSFNFIGYIWTLWDFNYGFSFCWTTSFISSFPASSVYVVIPNALDYQKVWILWVSEWCWQCLCEKRLTKKPKHQKWRAFTLLCFFNLLFEEPHSDGVTSSYLWARLELKSIF